MDTMDIIPLGVLCCIIGAGYLFRRQMVVRLIVVFILLCVIFGSVMFSSFAPRVVVTQHERQSGKSSQEFLEGVSSATKATSLFYPYILLSAGGLTLLAALSHKKEQDDA